MLNVISTWHNKEHILDSKPMKNKENKERPLECSSCVREIAVKYTEIQDSVIQCFYMCKECPSLEQYRLSETQLEHHHQSDLACGNCLTNLNEVQRGGLLGCSECYKSFEVFILKELKNNENLDFDDAPPLSHQGHCPGKLQELSPSLKILSLTEILDQTILEEDYEQAAVIRDQIQKLKNNTPEHD